MKKGILILSCFVVFGMCLVSVNKISRDSQGDKKAAEEVYSYLEDKGFTRVDISGKELKRYSNSNSFNPAMACMAYEPTMENYVKHADTIIKGEVTGIEYFDCNGIPWSRASVSVQDIILGNIENKNEICIYLMEGFLYNDINKDSLAAVSSDSTGLHNTGDISVFALKREDGKNIFEKGSYQRVCGHYSEYRYIKDKEKYHIDDTRMQGDLDEKELISKLKYFISKKNNK